ncbi:unnamed protein product [Coregonus sp. 'balchen']|nr:unnamed protein product [Coregonus sp. 'balchen']
MVVRHSQNKPSEEVMTVHLTKVQLGGKKLLTEMKSSAASTHTSKVVVRHTLSLEGEVSQNKHSEDIITVDRAKNIQLGGKKLLTEMKSSASAEHAAYPSLRQLLPLSHERPVSSTAFALSHERPVSSTAFALSHERPISSTAFALSHERPLLPCPMRDPSLRQLLPCPMRDPSLRQLLPLSHERPISSTAFALSHERPVSSTAFALSHERPVSSTAFALSHERPISSTAFALSHERPSKMVATSEGKTVEASDRNVLADTDGDVVIVWSPTEQDGSSAHGGGGGRPIDEWKRQVTAGLPQARLLDEEDRRRKENGTPAHNAIPGLSGELLTEDDLIHPEKQIQSVSNQKDCEGYETELARLAEELRTILPAPHRQHHSQLTVQKPQPGVSGDIPVPLWCNMCMLMANLADGPYSKILNTELSTVFSQIHRLQPGGRR